MKLMDFLKKNKLVRVLERHSIRDNTGWSQCYLIDGKEVPRRVFCKEELRLCLWRSENNNSGRGYAQSPEPVLALEEFRIITQYVPLPWYEY